MPRAFVFRSLLVVALSVGVVAACSATTEDSATTTLAPMDTTVSSTTEAQTDLSSTTTSSVVADPSTSLPPAQGAIAVAVYWNRPYGTPRPIDIPGYKDPDGGPYPYVLFGSVTNVGAAPISPPRVVVDWDLDGQSIHTATAQARDAQGATLPELAAGASADLIVVVESDSIAAQLADAQPTFGLVS